MIKIGISRNEHITATSHFHEEYELYFLLSGDVTHFVSETTYRIVSGDVVIVSPMVIHRTTAVNSGTRTRVILSFSEDELHDIKRDEAGITEFFDNIVVSCGKNGFAQIEQLLNQMLAEQKGKNNRVLQRAYLYQLIVMLKRQWEKGANLSKCAQNAVDSRISGVIKYINENYADDISLEFLAEKFFVSPAYLSRRFKEVTGFAYIEYLVNLRIKKAAELLEETQINITETAAAVGFASSNHFCKTFKKILGKSPMDYRNHHKNNLK